MDRPLFVALVYGQPQNVQSLGVRADAINRDRRITGRNGQRVVIHQRLLTFYCPTRIRECLTGEHIQSLFPSANDRFGRLRAKLLYIWRCEPGVSDLILVTDGHQLDDLFTLDFPSRLHIVLQDARAGAATTGFRAMRQKLPANSIFIEYRDEDEKEQGIAMLNPADYVSRTAYYPRR